MASFCGQVGSHGGYVCRVEVFQTSLSVTRMPTICGFVLKHHLRAFTFPQPIEIGVVVRSPASQEEVTKLPF